MKTFMLIPVKLRKYHHGEQKEQEMTENGIVAAIMVPHPPLIVPEVGRGGEQEIQATTQAYRRAAEYLAKQRPDTVIVISPHQQRYLGYFHISPGERTEGSFARFQAPQVHFSVTYDTELVAQIAEEAEAAGIAAGTLGVPEKELDHGTMVPLYFLEQYLKDYELVRIGVSAMPFLTHYEFGRCIQRAAEKSGKRVALIASGDLSHKLKEDGPYGFCEEGPVYDARIMDVMGRAAFEELFDFAEEFCDRAAECGHRSFTIMAGALDRREVTAEALSHEDVTGVGYGVCIFTVGREDEERNFGEKWRILEQERMRECREKEDTYVRLARSVIEEYIGTGRRLQVPRNLPKEFYERRAGVFVSIKKEGWLRGCIGTIAPTRENLAEEILENAISASTRDPRFDPIEPRELEKLVITVDVLEQPEDISSSEELDVIRYGVIVTKGRKHGLLLPNLDGVATVEEQLRIAKQKAGIDEEDTDVKLQRFEVVRHF